MSARPDGRTRPPLRKIVNCELDRNPPRELLTLECGHKVYQAPRKQRRKRVVCIECEDQAA